MKPIQVVLVVGILHMFLLHLGMCLYIERKIGEAGQDRCVLTAITLTEVGGFNRLDGAGILVRQHLASGIITGDTIHLSLTTWLQVME